MKQKILLYQQFIQACETANLSLVQELTTNGVEVDYHDHKALRLVSKLGHLELVKHFIEGYYSKHILPKDVMNTIFGFACGFGHLELVQYLTKHNANLRYNHDESFIRACNKEHYDIVNYFIVDLKFKLDDSMIEQLNKHCTPDIQQKVFVLFENRQLHLQKLEDQKQLNQAFLKVCSQYDLEQIKSYQQYGADITVLTPQLFEDFCFDGYLNIVQYLVKELSSLRNMTETDIIKEFIVKINQRFNFASENISYDPYLLRLICTKGYQDLLTYFIDKKAYTPLLNQQDDISIFLSSLENQISIIPQYFIFDLNLTLSEELKEELVTRYRLSTQTEVFNLFAKKEFTTHLESDLQNEHLATNKKNKI